MSTDLYGVRVLSIDPSQSTINLRVFVVYYDTQYKNHQPIPDDKSFFVRALSDKDAFQDDLSDDDRFNEDYIDRNAFRYIADLKQLTTRNYPVKSYKNYADFYYERGGAWKDEDKLVQADFEVTVTNPDYLAPFTVGQSWGTTAYMTQADLLSPQDYAHIPDFSDLVHTFIPFADLSGEHTTADSLQFSPDGTMLAVMNNESGVRVFSTQDWSLITYRKRAHAWGDYFDWADHHTLRLSQLKEGTTKQTKVKLPALSTPTSPTPYKLLMTRFALEIKAKRKLIYSISTPEDTLLFASVSPTAQRAAISIETEEAFIQDLDTNTKHPLPKLSYNGLAISPDGQYLAASAFSEGLGFLIIRLKDNTIIRSSPAPQRGLATAIAWSPTNNFVATSYCDARGYNSQIRIHRLGAAIEAQANIPVHHPTPIDAAGAQDFVRLFIEKTSLMETGWATHIDDRLHDLHIALVRAQQPLDLTTHMRSSHIKISALAYESFYLFEQGHTERANRALERAQDLLDVLDFGPAAYTQLYAPVAAATWRSGYPEFAQNLFDSAAANLDNTSNPFQNHAILLRAYLMTDQLELARTLIDENPSNYTNHFHQIALTDLVDHKAFDLLGLAIPQWNVNDSWSATQNILDLLINTKNFSIATSPAQINLTAHTSQLKAAWQSWLERDPDAAKKALEHARNLPDADAALFDQLDQARHAPTPPAPQTDPLKLASAQGDWAAAYTHLNNAPRAQRAAYYQTIAQDALKQGATSIALDAINHLTFNDMNASGIHALHKAHATLLPMLRAYHT